VSIEANKRAVRRLYEEAFTEGRLDVVDEVVADGMVNHTAPPGTPPGPEPVKRLIGSLRAAFPDGRIVIEEMVAEGDVVVMRNRYLGTHRGEFMGHAATGRSFDYRQMHMLRFREGQAIEHWGVRDDLGHLTQLGLT
jgi:predicted ester cyclase